MPAMNLSDRGRERGGRTTWSPCARAARNLDDDRFDHLDRRATRRRVRSSSRLHEWVTTVDHKRLGILYIVYALVFLVIGGIEATIMRIQLIAPHNDFVSPQVFNRMFTMHGTTMIFFVAMPLVFGFANYLVPLMIGARDMAFPRLNAFSFWLTAFGGLLLYFSFLGGSGLYGAGNAPDVGWFAYAPLTAKTFSPRTQHRLLDAGAAGVRLRQHRNRDQHHDHDPVHALPGDDPREDAAVRVAESHHGGTGDPGRESALRGADHVAGRPLPGRPFLRHAGGRLGGHLDALLLGLRPPGSLRARHPRLRVRVRDHPRVLAQSRSSATPSWWRPRSASGSSP